MRRIFLFLCLLKVVTLQAQIGKQYQADLKPAVFSLTMVMMHDVINPPAAARFYTYATLGAYDLLSAVSTGIPRPSSIFYQYKDMVISIDKKKLDPGFAAVYCILEGGKTLLPSGYMLEKELAEYEAKCRKRGLSEQKIQYSKEIAKQYVQHIVEFSKADRYNKLSTKIRYTPKKDEGSWYPTPPAYMEAVEPNWKIIRPMVLDSSEQCKPKLPVPFSKDTASEFHNLAMEVYKVGKSPTLEEREIAGFWDCNPFAVSSSGHLNVGFKKISPGGHWMNIASIASIKAKQPLEKALLVQVVTAATLMDAFISCWEEKYRSNRIRPETYINREIDPKWQPLLQTPPFPEYTSGHSVVSGAVAEVLTYFFGDSFAYTDDTELMFELPPRNFTSFRQAALEAAISRLYGGIHYKDAIDFGVEQGQEVGKLVVARLKKGSILTQR